MEQDTDWMELFYATEFEAQPCLLKEERCEVGMLMGMDVARVSTPVEAAVVGEQVVVDEIMKPVIGTGVNNKKSKRCVHSKRSDKVKVANRGAAMRSRVKKAAYFHDIETQLALSNAKVEQLEAYILEMIYKS
jgi:hypothetical protein